MNDTEKLQKKIFLKGKIEAKTGLHIGGTNAQMGIGGPDNFIIRNPLTQKPFIPGSSLKGKMRALLELTKGKYNTDPKKLGDVGHDYEITCLFGDSADKKQSAENIKKHASRLIVRDAELCNAEDENWQNTDMLYSETKTEVVINRLTSAAMPRNFERVPAGAEFEFEMVVNIVAKDNEVDEVQNRLLKLLAEGMELLQDDYLGGNGSRGYGQIELKELTITEKDYNSDEVNEKQAGESVKEHFKALMNNES